jgi:hypothetical protein
LASNPQSLVPNLQSPVVYYLQSARHPLQYAGIRCNTGAPFGGDTDMRPVRQTILHDLAHPSPMMLQIVPR